jgi:hypothetical protein
MSLQGAGTNKPAKRQAKRYPNRSVTTMRYNPSILLLVCVAGVSLAACEKKTSDAQADAVRDTTQAAASSIENKADAVEAQGETTGNATENNAAATADAMRDRADSIKDAGEEKADAIEAGKIGATTKTDTMTTTTEPAKK